MKRDAVLTELGRSQCAQLREKIDLFEDIELVLSSPLRRAIQTTCLAFDPLLARPEIPLLLVPNAQEVGNNLCDIGFPMEDIEAEIVKLFDDIPLSFDVKKIDRSLLTKAWNSKVCRAPRGSNTKC